MSRDLGTPGTSEAHALEVVTPWLWLLKVDHPSLPAPLYLVNDTTALVTTGAHPGGAHTWQPFPFEFQPAKQAAGELAVAKLTVDAIGVDRELVAGVQNADPLHRIEIQAWLVRASVPDEPIVSSPPLHWRNVQWHAELLDGEVVPPEDFVASLYPRGRFTPNNMPGIF